MQLKSYFVAAMAVVLLAIPACRKSNLPIKTEKHTFAQVAYLSENKTDSLNVSFDIEFPVNQNDTAFLLIQESLKKQLFGANYAKISIEDAMRLYYNDLRAEYLDNQSLLEQLEFVELRFNFEHLLTANVVAVQKNLLSYAIERYVYMGGAHGINTRYFFNFNLKTGALITENDIFTEGYEQYIPTLLIQSLIEQNDDLQLISDLYETNYAVTDIVPNGNFFVTTDGITYVFNPYEIAPYAYGQTEIFIAADKIKPYLKPEWQVFEN